MTSSAHQAFEARVVESYTLRPKDLAIFRILYASFVLVAVVPVAAWLPKAPQAFFNPPIGLAALFTSFATSGVLICLNLLLSLFAAMLLVGWKTGVASAGTGLTLLALNSWAYSLGKINHDILLVITPLVLGCSVWGRALSVDAVSRSPAAREREGSVPLALLALLVGFAMFTAGLAKVTTGWLDPEFRCTYGHLVVNYRFTGRETWAAKLALGVDWDWFWKLADWAPVFMELAFLPAAIHRRSFCLILAVASLFHLGVLLLFDIPFGVNLLAYGAFVRWTELPLLRTLSRVATHHSRPMTTFAFLAAFAVGLAATLGGRAANVALHFPLNSVVVWLGAAFGVGYIFSPFCGRGQRALGSQPLRQTGAT